MVVGFTTTYAIGAHQLMEEVGIEKSHIHCFLILSDLILYYNTIARLTFTSPPPPHGDGYVQPCEEVGMEVSHTHCFLILSDLILYYNTITRLTFTSPPPPHGDGYVQPCEEVGMEVSHAHCFLILSDLILYYNTTTVPWTRWGPRRSPDPSPTSAPPNVKSWICA